MNVSKKKEIMSFCDLFSKKKKKPARDDVDFFEKFYVALVFPLIILGEAIAC